MKNKWELLNQKERSSHNTMLADWYIRKLREVEKKPLPLQVLTYLNICKSSGADLSLITMALGLRSFEEKKNLIVSLRYMLDDKRIVQRPVDRPKHVLRKGEPWYVTEGHDAYGFYFTPAYDPQRR